MAYVCRCCLVHVYYDAAKNKHAYINYSRQSVSDLTCRTSPARQHEFKQTVVCVDCHVFRLVNVESTHLDRDKTTFHTMNTCCIKYSKTPVFLRWPQVCKKHLKQQQTISFTIVLCFIISLSFPSVTYTTVKGLDKGCFFLVFFSVRLLSVLRGHLFFFILATTANDLRLRRISIPDLTHYSNFLS